MSTEWPPPLDSTGKDWRRASLTTPPETLGFSPDADFPDVYGILTDWNLGGATATIMSMRDGTTSLFTTSTFGVIGGKGHPSVRQLAEFYVKLAGQYVDSARLVTDFPYPHSGQVFFYLLTYNGVRLCVGDEARINQGSDPTRPLFAAAQDVLTQLRLVSEENKT